MMLKRDWSFLAFILGSLLVFAPAVHAVGTSAEIENQKVYTLATQMLSSVTTAAMVEKLLLASVEDSQKKEVESWLGSHRLATPGKASVSAHGLQMNNGGRVETIRMVDGRPGYYLVRGIEVDLSNSRPLGERYASLQAVLSTPKGALHKLFIFEAYAAEERAHVDAVTTDVLAASSATNGAKAQVNLVKVNEHLHDSTVACRSITKRMHDAGPVKTIEIAPASLEVSKTISQLQQRFCGGSGANLLQNLASFFSAARTTPATICDSLKTLSDCMSGARYASSAIGSEHWSAVSAPLAKITSVPGAVPTPGPAGGGSGAAAGSKVQ